MKLKLWLWIFEFKLKRVKDDKKIEFLTKELLKELEAQGYNLQSYTTGHFDMWLHGNKLSIENLGKEWKIDCGKYNRKLVD
jgi:hypothetical protein